MYLISSEGPEKDGLVAVISALRPKNFLVINSEVGYQVLTHQSIERVIKNRVAVFFASDTRFSANQFIVRWLHQLCKSATILTDNLQTMRFTQEIDGGKIACIPAEVDAGARTWKPGARKKVALDWAF